MLFEVVGVAHLEDEELREWEGSGDWLAMTSSAAWTQDGLPAVEAADSGVHRRVDLLVDAW